MATRNDVQQWVLSALKHHNGSASIVQVAKFIWEKYENELRHSGDLFYTWQYEMRWAAQRLRDSGVCVKANKTPTGIWVLNKTA